jgi:hypothetical protein
VLLVACLRDVDHSGAVVGMLQLTRKGAVLECPLKIASVFITMPCGNGICFEACIHLLALQDRCRTGMQRAVHSLCDLLACLITCMLFSTIYAKEKALQEGWHAPCSTILDPGFTD